MNEDEVPDFFDAVFAAEPDAEFGVWCVPFIVREGERIGIDEVLLPDVSEVSFEVHEFVIAENDVNFAALSRGFGFEFIQEPQAFGNVRAAVEDITDEYEMPVSERPVEP